MQSQQPKRTRSTLIKNCRKCRKLLEKCRCDKEEPKNTFNRKGQVSLFRIDPLFASFASDLLYLATILELDPYLKAQELELEPHEVDRIMGWETYRGAW